MSNVRDISTAEVRAWYQADEKRINALSEKAQVTVRKGARGRLHPEAVTLHNKRRRSVNYAEGLSGKQMRAAKALRAELVAQGKAGKRGPLPKQVAEDLAVLAAQG